MITVEKWIAYDDVDAVEFCTSRNIGTCGGWFNFTRGGLRWVDFLESWDECVHPYLEALRSEIMTNRIRRGGFWHQEDPHGVPVFSDGVVATYSMRAWGDLQAAIWSEVEDCDYNYCDFAWER